MTAENDLINVKQEIVAKRARLAVLFEDAEDASGDKREALARTIKSANDELTALADRAETLNREARMNRMERETVKALRAPGKRQINPRDDDVGYSSPNAPGVLQAIKSADSFASNFGGGTSVSLDAYLRAALTGDWDRLPADLYRGDAVKQLSTDALGDLTLPSTLTNRVIDIARAKSQVIAAGALTARMGGPTETIARVATPATPDWKVENALIAESTIEFEPVTLTARTLAARAVLSVELSDDVPTIGNAVEAELSAALAAELDRAALLGSGTPPEPRGLVNTTGVTSTDVSAGLPGDYSDFSLAVQRIRAANLEPNSVVLGPDVMGELERLTNSLGDPLTPPASYVALGKYPTTALAETAIVGDWSRFLVAIRQELRIEASRTASDENGLGFASYSVLVRATLRADFAVLKPAAFQVLTDFAPGS